MIRIFQQKKSHNWKENGKNKNCSKLYRFGKNSKIYFLVNSIINILFLRSFLINKRHLIHVIVFIKNKNEPRKRGYTTISFTQLSQKLNIYTCFFYSF